MADYLYKIGLDAGGVAGLVNIESLSTPVPAPHSSWIEGQQFRRLADGTLRVYGYPVAVWRWDFLKRAQRDMLRTYCTGASAVVCIATRKNDSADAYVTYRAVMEWPQEEEKDAGRRMDFELRFTCLEVIT